MSDKPNWSPKHITYLKDYKPTETLTLEITQLDNVSYYRQREIIDQWCAELPNLEEVKYLGFVSRVNQKMFDAACNMPNLKGLFIKWSGVKNIDALRIPKKLRHLWLGGSSQVESIDVLGELDLPPLFGSPAYGCCWRTPGTVFSESILKRNR